MVYTKTMFTSNTSFVVPDGVTKIRVCAVGGGAGGKPREDYFFYYTGSDSKFGKYVTARGATGQGGGGYVGIKNWFVSYGQGGSCGGSSYGGVYGDSGGSESTSYGTYQGGGSGQFINGTMVTVTPGETIDIVIGLGGAGRYPGTQGCVQIEYGGVIECKASNQVFMLL